jgi:hypothetical protein
VKLRTAGLGRCRERWKAVLTTPGRSGTARQGGSGKQDEKVYERNQRVKLRKRRAGSNLVDMGRSAAHTCRDRAAGDSEAGMNRPAGRPRGKPAAYSWRGCRGIAGHLLRRTVGGERGNHLRLPSRCSIQDIEGQARRRLSAAVWGGGPVVVRARERRVHGEGGQQVSRADAGMLGGRR